MGGLAGSPYHTPNCFGVSKFNLANKMLLTKAYLPNKKRKSGPLVRPCLANKMLLEPLFRGCLKDRERQICAQGAKDRDSFKHVVAPDPCSYITSVTRDEITQHAEMRLVKTCWNSCSCEYHPMHRLQCEILGQGMTLWDATKADSTKA